MKWMLILLILSLIGCTPKKMMIPCKTLGKSCERSIKQVGDDCFEISVNRANLNKINKGSECLGLTVQKIETVEGWSDGELALFVAGAAVLFFSGGFYVGGK